MKDNKTKQARRRYESRSPSEKGKWFLLIPYAGASLWLWNKRYMIPSPFGNFTRDAVCLALLLVGFVCLVQLLRTPILMRRQRFAEAVQQIGLCNAQEDYPTLISARKDREKRHGVILTIRNVGLALADYELKRDRLQTALGGRIYCMELGRKHTIQIYFLPQKYVHPTLISPDDATLGKINIQELINLLTIGATGGGKTVALKIIVSKIVKFVPNAKIWLLDFKQLDFNYLSECPRYYGYADCVQGLNDYYNAFKRQQEAGVAGAPNYLVIDEWGSLLLSMDRREAEQAKAKLAELLMLGRAYSFIPIIGIQRPDASFFGSARDNFQCCLALSNLSPEGRRMAFPDSVAGQIDECQKREGHLHINGIGLEKIRIVDVDISALDSVIKEAMCC